MLLAILFALGLSSLRTSIHICVLELVLACFIYFLSPNAFLQKYKLSIQTVSHLTRLSEIDDGELHNLHPDYNDMPDLTDIVSEPRCDSSNSTDVDEDMRYLLLESKQNAEVFILLL